MCQSVIMLLERTKMTWSSPRLHSRASSVELPLALITVTKIYLSVIKQTSTDLFEDITRWLWSQQVSDWTEQNCLHLNKDKTEIIVLGAKEERLKHEDHKPDQRFERSPGLRPDHLKSISRILSQQDLENSVQDSDQTAAADKTRRDHFSPVLMSLHWLPVIVKQSCWFMEPWLVWDQVCPNWTWTFSFYDPQIWNKLTENCSFLCIFCFIMFFYYVYTHTNTHTHHSQCPSTCQKAVYLVAVWLGNPCFTTNQCLMGWCYNQIKFSFHVSDIETAGL